VRFFDTVVVRDPALRTGQAQLEQTYLAQRVGIRLDPGIDYLPRLWTAKSQQPHFPTPVTSCGARAPMVIRAESISYDVMETLTSVFNRIGS
jgi:hypothetical protein